MGLKKKEKKKMKKKTERHLHSPELYPESNFLGSKDTLPVLEHDQRETTFTVFLRLPI